MRKCLKAWQNLLRRGKSSIFHYYMDHNTSQNDQHSLADELVSEDLDTELSLDDLPV